MQATSSCGTCLHAGHEALCRSASTSTFPAYGLLQYLTFYVTFQVVWPHDPISNRPFALICYICSGAKQLLMSDALWPQVKKGGHVYYHADGLYSCAGCFKEYRSNKVYSHVKDCPGILAAGTFALRGHIRACDTKANAALARCPDAERPDLLAQQRQRAQGLQRDPLPHHSSGARATSPSAPSCSADSRGSSSSEESDPGALAPQQVPLWSGWLRGRPLGARAKQAGGDALDNSLTTGSLQASDTSGKPDNPRVRYDRVEGLATGLCFRFVRACAPAELLSLPPQPSSLLLPVAPTPGAAPSRSRSASASQASGGGQGQSAGAAPSGSMAGGLC